MTNELCNAPAAARRAFTLLEVVIALAMLAVIAVPAIGLATMAVSRGKQQLITSNATELKNRIDVALRSYVNGTTDVFTEDFSSSASFAFVASEDLLYIEQKGGTLHSNNDRYYHVAVTDPVNHSYDRTKINPYRILTYKVIWPTSATPEEQEQLYFTAVFRK